MAGRAVATTQEAHRALETSATFWSAVVLYRFSSLVVKQGTFVTALEEPCLPQSGGAPPHSKTWPSFSAHDSLPFFEFLLV